MLGAPRNFDIGNKIDTSDRNVGQRVDDTVTVARDLKSAGAKLAGETASFASASFPRSPVSRISSFTPIIPDVFRIAITRINGGLDASGAACLAVGRGVSLLDENRLGCKRCKVSQHASRSGARFGGRIALARKGENASGKR